MPDPFVFVSGRPSLDLAGTLKWRRSEPEELLGAPEAAARWAVDAGLVDTPPEVDAAGLADVHAVREAVYALALARSEQRPWDAGALAQLERAAGPVPVTPRLQPDGSLRRTGQLAAVLSAVARDAAELLGGPEAERIRECAGEACTRLFVDASRGAPRRWCGMQECGNRAKAASYRRRRRAPA
ncbi:CGNR zinc finger domain-containing protein [Modestobacter sp. NPDC049651]|uniref:CGNR zinc finger domain-containing protein n=1 Tax=unclassified Modestobacter TaxID=2643866 RepID=UPI0033E8D92D